MVSIYIFFMTLFPLNLDSFCLFFSFLLLIPNSACHYDCVIGMHSGWSVGDTSG